MLHAIISGAQQQHITASSFPCLSFYYFIQISSLPYENVCDVKRNVTEGCKRNHLQSATMPRQDGSAKHLDASLMT